VVRRYVMMASIAMAGCSADEPEKGGVARPLSVRTATVGTSDQTPEISVIGSAFWRVETPLGFTSAGQIVRITVNEGDRVQRGQLLALLDTTPVQAELAAAEAEARRAGSEAARLSTLFKQGWVTKARLEAAQAGALSSAATVKARRFALDTARIVAPSDGVVLARSAEPTQVVAAGSPVITLGEARAGFVLRAPLNDRLATSIALGSPAIVMFQALGAEPMQGRVQEIGGKANRATGTFDVEIALPNDPRVRSGMIGTARLMASQSATIRKPQVPPAAIIAPRAGEALVYILDAKNVARLRKVRIGEATDSGVDVVSGVTLGDRVVLSGFDRLKDGMTVAPVARAR
jgi:RND family efflux transporter MFP subunit